MDHSDVALIRSSFERGLAEASPADVVAVLAELGWDELAEVEPQVAVEELFEAQGRLHRASAALDLVVAEALGVALPDGAALVHPTLAAPDAPAGRLVSGQLVVADGLVLAGPGRASRLAVPLNTAAGTALVVMDRSAMSAETLTGFDDMLGLERISGAAEVEGAACPCDWVVATSAARRALAHELLGLAGEMLRTAARHVTERFQFGKPVATFQTVRHRLTEVHVAVAAVRPVLDAAWITGEPLAADAAKALAGRAALLAAKHCLQVTGAIGFTWEYGLHHQIRRAHVLDAFYGSARELQSAIGARLLAERSVPRIRPLP